MNQMPPFARNLLAATLLGLAGYMLLRRHGPNPWIGVRLPWTMADREVWDKSWVLAIVLLAGMGLGALFFLPVFWISVIALLVLGIGYPLFLYRRKYGTWRYWKDIGRLDYRPVVRCAQCGHFRRLGYGEELAGLQCEVCGALLARYSGCR